MARAKKTICPVCKRVVKAGGKCPLAPHMMIAGRVVRPINLKKLQAR